MAITFVNSTQDDTGVATSVSLALPTSVQDDDLLLAYCFNGQDDGTWSAPAGWTNVMTKADAVGSDSNVGVWYKVASSESGPYSFDSASSTSNQTAGMILAFRGVDTTTPLDVTFVEGNHYTKTLSSGTSITVDSITTNTAGAEVVVFCTNKGSTTTAISVPNGGGYTEHEEILGPQRYSAGSSTNVASVSTEAPGTISFTGAAAGDEGLSITLALKPEAAAGGGGVPAIMAHRRLLGIS